MPSELRPPPCGLNACILDSNPTALRVVAAACEGRMAPWVQQQGIQPEGVRSSHEPTLLQPDAATQARRSELLIAFDADDTLWHNEIHYRRAAEKFRQLLSRRQQSAPVERALAETEIRNIRWYGYGFKSYTLSMIEAAVHVTAGQIPAREILLILEFGREMLAANVQLFERARATLALLSKKPDLMLITKGDLLEQDDKLRRSGLADLFRYTEIIAEKSVQAYGALLHRYSIPPHRFVMVGNSLKSDVLPVIEIGARAVFVPYEHTWAHEHADGRGHTCYEIQHLGELPDLIAHLAA